MNYLSGDEKEFIYRWYIWKILYYFHNWTVKSDSYLQIKEYYDVWEEALSLNLIIISLLELEFIPFSLWKLLVDILEKYPPDWFYIQRDSSEKLVKRIKSSQIILPKNS